MAASAARKEAWSFEASALNVAIHASSDLTASSLESSAERHPRKADKWPILSPSGSQNSDHSRDGVGVRSKGSGICFQSCNVPHQVRFKLLIIGLTESGKP
jgi:hypothetical protein